MADSFRASFVLQLKDDLSGGLRRVIADVKQLRDLAKGLGFKPLEGADAIVNRIDRDVQQLNRSLGTTARQAETAAGALRRTSAAELGRAEQQAGSLRRNAALARQAAAAGGLTSGPTIVTPTEAQLLRRQTALARQAAATAGLPSGNGAIPLGAPQAGAVYQALPPPRVPVPSIPTPPPRVPVPSIPLAPGPWNDVSQAPRVTAPGLLSRAGSAFGGGLAGARGRLGAFGDSVGLAGGALAGISLMQPIREAAEFDNVLTHIAITAGATEGAVRSKVAGMAETYRAMALATRQSSHDVGESAQFLITTGIGEEMTNRLLPIIAKAATAYNTPMRDAVQGAFSMHEELKIAPEDMQGALSATALAAKQGHFSFSDFSSFLPSIAAQAGVSGIRGRGGLNVLLAALETSRRGAGTSGQAATNLQDFLSYINAPIGTKSFAKAGINLPGLKLAAEKAGQNPIEAVIEAVRRRTSTMSDAQKGTFLGSIFHNQEARIFAQTMLSELKYYEETRKKVSEAGDATIDEDFRKAQNLHTRLAALSESSHQLTQRIGLGFSWVVPVGTGLLTGVLAGLTGIDHVVPGLADGVIALTGGMLGLVAVMGVLGTVAGPIKAGFALLRLGAITRSVFSLAGLQAVLNPWTAALLLVGAAAYDIWQHWDRFKQNFHWMWAGLQQAAGGFGQFLSGVFAGDNARALEGLHTIWAGFHRFMESLWGPAGVIATLLNDFIGVIPPWGQKLVTGFGTIIEQSLAGWQKFFADLGSMFSGFKPDFNLPKTPFMVPPGLDNPDNWPRYQPKAPAVPDGRSPDHEGHAVPLKSAYRTGGGDDDAKLQRIHVTFESDTPGRATVRHDDGSGRARGPMLIRA